MPSSGVKAGLPPRSPSLACWLCWFWKGWGRAPWPHTLILWLPRPPAAYLWDLGGTMLVASYRQGYWPASGTGINCHHQWIFIRCWWVGIGHPARSHQGETEKHRWSSCILEGQDSLCRMSGAGPPYFLASVKIWPAIFSPDRLAKVLRCCYRVRALLFMKFWGLYIKSFWSWYINAVHYYQKTQGRFLVQS